jgi:DNA-binding NarL/FixJ family response regulator
MPTWQVVYDELTPQEEPDVGDLLQLATACYMLGHDEEHAAAMERAHLACLEAGDRLRAAWCAFWAGMPLMLRGEVARGAGWLARGQRLVEEVGGECVEHGYLMLPGVFQREAAGDHAGAAAVGGYKGSMAEAAYVQGEVHRLRGAFDAAEDAYREASRLGREPQPGLALMRLAQGKTGAAATSIRRALGETTDRFKRTRLLPAVVAVMVAAGDLDAARAAAEELGHLAAAAKDIGVLGAIAAQAGGTIALAEGDAAAALPLLRRAAQVWQGLEAPYEAARVRALLAEALRVAGDDQAAALEAEAARDAFTVLGVVAPAAVRRGRGRLTDRELEVLRLVAAGETNRSIATRLVLSERTVDRHVSNIFAKLGVSSRAAATAHAYEHGLR